MPGTEGPTLLEDLAVVIGSCELAEAHALRVALDLPPTPVGEVIALRELQRELRERLQLAMGCGGGQFELYQEQRRYLCRSSAHNYAWWDGDACEFATDLVSAIDVRPTPPPVAPPLDVPEPRSGP